MQGNGEVGVKKSVCYRQAHMPLRPVVRAVIFDEDDVILLKRIKKDETYYAFPGGGVEEGETNEQAVIREAKEETGLDVAVETKIAEQVFLQNHESFYECRITGGELGTGTGPEYQEGNSYDGEYHAVRIPLSEIKALPVLPEHIKKQILA